MAHRNVEIKARCGDPESVRRVLRRCGAEFRGTDRQRDTYFHCASGRLKLRQGNIERSLIHYRREDRPGPKQAEVTLCRAPPDPDLEAVLAAALGVRVVVTKTREIYFIGNVKFHLDDVDRLGWFVEIEAIDAGGRLGPEALHAQCRRYMELLGIRRADLLSASYGEMLSAEQGAAGGLTPPRSRSSGPPAGPRR